MHFGLLPLARVDVSIRIGHRADAVSFTILVLALVGRAHDLLALGAFFLAGRHPRIFTLAVLHLLVVKLAFVDRAGVVRHSGLARARDPGEDALLLGLLVGHGFRRAWGAGLAEVARRSAAAPRVAAALRNRGGLPRVCLGLAEAFGRGRR